MEKKISHGKEDHQGENGWPGPFAETSREILLCLGGSEWGWCRWGRGNFSFFSFFFAFFLTFLCFSSLFSYSLRGQGDTFSANVSNPRGGKWKIHSFFRWKMPFAVFVVVTESLTFDAGHFLEDFLGSFCRRKKRQNPATESAKYPAAQQQKSANSPFCLKSRPPEQL